MRLSLLISTHFAEAAVNYAYSAINAEISRNLYGMRVSACLASAEAAMLLVMSGRADTRITLPARRKLGWIAPASSPGRQHARVFAISTLDNAQAAVSVTPHHWRRRANCGPRTRNRRLRRAHRHAVQMPSLVRLLTAGAR